jgi:8-oxo-dGTP pyrophosphatase MutT (NUDIX family)
VSSQAEHEYTLLEQREVFRGPIFSVVSDQVAMPGGGSAQRDYLRHPGSVVVVALDADERVCLVRQYRHAVRAYLWELPAGLTDVPGETPVQCAARELAEEVDLVAGRFDLLTTVYATPGYSTELSHAYLARELTAVPADQLHRREHEEAELVPHWVALDEAVVMVFRGELAPAVDAVAVLAAAQARAAGWAPLRSAS